MILSLPLRTSFSTVSFPQESQAPSPLQRLSPLNLIYRLCPSTPPNNSPVQLVVTNAFRKEIGDLMKKTDESHDALIDARLSGRYIHFKDIHDFLDLTHELHEHYLACKNGYTHTTGIYGFAYPHIPKMVRGYQFLHDYWIERMTTFHRHAHRQSALNNALSAIEQAISVSQTVDNNGRKLCDFVTIKASLHSRKRQTTCLLQLQQVLEEQAPLTQDDINTLLVPHQSLIDGFPSFNFTLKRLLRHYEPKKSLSFNSTVAISDEPLTTPLDQTSREDRDKTQAARLKYYLLRYLCYQESAQEDPFIKTVPSHVYTAHHNSTDKTIHVNKLSFNLTPKTLARADALISVLQQEPALTMLTTYLEPAIKPAVSKTVIQTALEQLRKECHQPLK